MKIVNNTDTKIVITGLDTIGSKKIFAGEFAYLYLDFDTISITCRYGRVDVVKTQEFDARFQLYPHEDLDATYEFDFKYHDFVMTVFRVTADDKRSQSCVEQQDETLHDKSIRDDSIHMNSAHITAYKRIEELTDAIQKSIQKCVPNDDTTNVKSIRNWAKEIMLQCNIIDSIDEN